MFREDSLLGLKWNPALKVGGLVCSVKTGLSH